MEAHALAEILDAVDGRIKPDYVRPMNLHAVANPRPDRRKQDAFTFTDLLAVLGVVAALALLTLTAMAHSQPSSDRAGCANNLRRLMQAWQMYADDNSGQLMARSTESVGYLPWVYGYMDFSFSNSDNTNLFKLTNQTYSAIAPYVNSSGLFRCPADPSTLVLPGGAGPRLRVRSYSMSEMMGNPTLSSWSPTFQVMTKTAEISQPDRIFVLLEEHPDSLNDSQFAIDLGNVGPAARIIDYPGAFHLGAANLGKADGHVENWQWADGRTMPPMTFTATLPLNVASPNNPDVARLQAAASYRK